MLFVFLVVVLYSRNFRHVISRLIHCRPEQLILLNLDILLTLRLACWSDMWSGIHQIVIVYSIKLSLNNFLCSLISQRLPIWWRWYYWANPVAWSLYGLLISQYGDDNNSVKLSDGNLMSIRQVLKVVFGYRRDFLCVAAIMVAGFCIFFAIIFAFAIKSFNFQRRWWDWLSKPLKSQLYVSFQ